MSTDESECDRQKLNFWAGKERQDCVCVDSNNPSNDEMSHWYALGKSNSRPLPPLIDLDLSLSLSVFSALAQSCI
jgi:hypothetical protein